MSKSKYDKELEKAYKDLKSFEAEKTGTETTCWHFSADFSHSVQDSL